MLRWMTVLGVVAVWQLLAASTGIAHEYLASPWAIVRDGMPDVFGSGLEPLWATTTRFLIAFVIVAILGTLIGMFMGRTQKALYLGSRDVISVLYAMPQVPFYPLFVLWLGLGARSEIAFAVTHGVIPVVLLTMSVSAEIKVSLLDASACMGAGRIRQLTHVVLPSVVSEVVGGLKVGAALTLLGLLLAELMISVDGVGSYIEAQIANQSAARLNAMVLVICIGAVLVNTVLSAVERRASAWRTL